MNNKELLNRGATNALGTAVYIALVTFIMRNGGQFADQADNKVIGPIAFLLLFVCSALITSGLVLGKPIMLYLDGEKRIAVKLLFYTGGSLFILMVLAFLGMYLSR